MPPLGAALNVSFGLMPRHHPAAAMRRSGIRAFGHSGEVVGGERDPWQTLPLSCSPAARPELSNARPPATAPSPDRPASRRVAAPSGMPSASAAVADRFASRGRSTMASAGRDRRIIGRRRRQRSVVGSRTRWRAPVRSTALPPRARHRGSMMAAAATERRRPPTAPRCSAEASGHHSARPGHARQERLGPPLQPDPGSAPLAQGRRA